MEIILDTANTGDIQKYCEIYNISGVTTNPSIVSKEKKDFFPMIRKIREIIGDRTLHVQVLAPDWQGMLKEAEALFQNVDKKVYIKIPTCEEGVHAMKALKEKGANVTATAIYTVQQAMLAASVGADYVAPYYNRMNNLNIDSGKAIGDMASLYKMHGLKTKIVAASFKNTQQIMDALLSGAHAVTVPTDLLTAMVSNAVIDGAIAGFKKDWSGVYGNRIISDF